MRATLAVIWATLFPSYVRLTIKEQTLDFVVAHELHVNRAAFARVFTNAGKPCRAAATEGGPCFFHGNPQKAAELGRIGGRKKYRTITEVDPLPNCIARRRYASGSHNSLRRSTQAGLNPKVALSLTQLPRLLLHVLPAVGCLERPMPAAATHKRLLREQGRLGAWAER